MLTVDKIRKSIEDFFPSGIVYELDTWDTRDLPDPPLYPPFPGWRMTPPDTYKIEDFVSHKWCQIPAIVFPPLYPESQTATGDISEGYNFP